MEHLNTLEPSSSAIKRPPRTLQGGDEVEMVEPRPLPFQKAADATEERRHQVLWAPPQGGDDSDLEAAMEAHLGMIAATPSRELVDTARRSPGLPPLLATAQVAAERAPTDALALIRSGIVQWIRDVFNRPDAIGSPTASHRLCFALHSMLRWAPPESTSLLREAILTGERQSTSKLASGSSGTSARVHAIGAAPLSALLCTAVRRHATYAPLLDEACRCLGLFGRRGGASGAAAVLSAGGIEAVVEAMTQVPEAPEVQAAGSAALAGLLAAERAAAAANGSLVTTGGSSGGSNGGGGGGGGGGGDGGGRPPIAESALSRGALLCLGGALRLHPDHNTCIEAALEALVLLCDILAPPFAELWPEVEDAREGETAAAAAASVSASSSITTSASSVRHAAVVAAVKPTGAQARAARHAVKVALPMLCAALLLRSSPSSSAPTPHSRALLRLLAACARLGCVSASSKLFGACERVREAVADSAAARDCISDDRRGARAACELWALLPPPQGGTAPAESLHLLLSAAATMRAAPGDDDDNDEEAGSGGGRRVAGRKQDDGGGGGGSGSDEYGRRILGAREVEEHETWCAALLTLCRRSRAGGATAGGAVRESASSGWPAEALMHAALRSGGLQHSAALPPALSAVLACLHALPAARAAEACEALCTAHGLLASVRRALAPAMVKGVAADGACGTADEEGGGGTGTGAGNGNGNGGGGGELAPLDTCSVRGIAAGLAAAAYLVRTGGSVRGHALALPLLKRSGGLTALLLRRAELRRAVRVQAAGCDLIAAVAAAGGGGGGGGGGRGSSHAEHTAKVYAALAALEAHGTHSARVAVAACDALGALASVMGAAALDAAAAKAADEGGGGGGAGGGGDGGGGGASEDDTQPAAPAEGAPSGSVARPLAAALRAHASERAVVSSAVHVLRMLCTDKSGGSRGGGGGDGGGGGGGGGRALKEFKDAGGRELVRAALSTHGTAMRGVGAEALLAAL